MSDQNKLQLIEEAQHFFFDLIQTSLLKRKLKPKPNPETQVYLAELLKQFISAERLFVVDAEGNRHQEPLAFMLKGALEESDPQSQHLMFRQLGDVSLYTAGYFHESLTHRKVDLDYYIDLGGKAYKNVAHRSPKSRAIYEELSARFAEFVEVLADVGDETRTKSEKDLLRLYETWLSTGSNRAAKALQEAGIQPVVIGDPKKC